MADETPGYALSGFIVPRQWSPDYAADHASGTDYTEADRRVGSVTFSGTQGAARLALEVTGEADSALTAAPEIKVTRGGVPGYNGCGIVYRYGSGSWFGANPLNLLTAYEVIRVGSAGTRGARYTSTVQRDDGLWYVFISEDDLSAGTSKLYASTWEPDVGWGAAFQAVTETGLNGTSLPVSAMRAPDGAIHVYWAIQGPDGTSQVGLWRRDGSGLGSTYLQTRDVGVPVTSTTIGLHFVEHQGAVVGFETTASGSRQWISTDGGYSFSAVAARESSKCVLAVLSHAGFLLVLTGEGGAAYARRIASPAQDLWAAGREQIASGCDRDAGGMLALTDEGVLGEVLTNSNQMYKTWKYTRDAGETWNETGNSAFSGHNNATTVARGSMFFARGRLHVVGVETSSTTGLARSNASVVDCVIGGHSTVTPSGDELPVLAAESFVGLCDLADTGWSGGTDTGTPTRVRTNVSYTTITTGAGEEAVNENSYLPGTDYANTAIFKVEVVSGSAQLRVFADDRSTTAYVTATSISFDETGTGPVYVSHGVTGAIEIMVHVDSVNNRAAAWFRAATYSDEKAWSSPDLIASFATATSSKTGSSIVVPESSVVKVYYGAMIAGPTFGNADLGAGVASTGINLRPVPVLSGLRTYLGSGLFVRGRGGPGRYDANTYTPSLNGGRYARRNMYPQIAPSPRTRWRSSGSTASPLASTQVLKFSLDQTAGAVTRWASDVVGIYLGGLVNVPKVIVRNAGSAIQTCDLRAALAYAHDDGVVYPSESGSVVSGAYVVAGSLAGCAFEFANGVKRTIRDNTAGTLTSGSTVAEPRCEIFLEGITGAEDTSGAGYIWPDRALLIYYCRGTRAFQRLELVMDSADPLDSRGYREVGVVAAGEITVLGRAFDRTVSMETRANVALAETRDGASYTSVEGPTRRTMELAFVESATFLDELRTGGAMGYVTASAHASADPVAARRGVTADVEGIYRRITGASLPVVALRRIPRDSGSGNQIYVATIARGTLADDAVYGRVTGSVRREQIQVGAALVDDAERIATITIQEIV